MSETPEPQHISEILKRGVPVGEPDETRAHDVAARDLQSEHAGLQAAREATVEHVAETGDPSVGQALVNLTAEQVAVRAEMYDEGIPPSEGEQ